jgi:hypothetical protein
MRNACDAVGVGKLPTQQSRLKPSLVLDAFQALNSLGQACRGEERARMWGSETFRMKRRWQMMDSMCFSE